MSACPKGHAYTAENTQRLPNGARVCRTCKRARDREYRQRGGRIIPSEPIEDVNARFLAAYLACAERHGWRVGA